MSPFAARAAAAAVANNNNVSSSSSKQQDSGRNDCSCPKNQCKMIERIPPGNGVMIMLNDADSHATDNNASNSNSDDDNISSKKKKKKCSCLKLQSQQDFNLTTIHPNIYIPSPFLANPTHLQSYSGGGSGVTVFGGYHPRLGSVVMKHGGFKDLIELVSLAKIEREVVVRGGWKIDCLLRRRDKILLGQEEEVFDNGDNGNDDDNNAECGGYNGWLNTDHGSLAALSSAAAANETILAKKRDDGDGLTSIHSDAVGGNNGTNTTTTTTTTTLKSKSNQMLNKLRNTTLATLIFKRKTSSSSSQQQQTQIISQLNDQITQIQNAMTQIQQRIPAFKMIYISPMHLRERKSELVNSGSSFRRSSMKKREQQHLLLLDSCQDSERKNVVVMNDGGDEDDNDDEREEEELQIESKGNINENNNNNKRQQYSTSRRVVTRTTSTVGRKGRHINLFGADHVKNSSFDVGLDHVDICFGGSYLYKSSSSSSNIFDEEEEVSDESLSPSSSQHTCHTSADGSDGYSTLMAFVHQLQEHQKANEWKVTLAQQTIGTTFENGDINKPKSARTASSLLFLGKLEGKLLHHLIDEEIQMIRNMQLLTMPEEANVLEQVRNEYEDIILQCQQREGRLVSAEDVSDLMNDFVGKAIHKNFHPKHGRFVMLRQFGRDLRNGEVHLTEAEVVPAKHLENLFYNHLDVKEGLCPIEMKRAVSATFFILTPRDNTIEEDDGVNVDNGVVGSSNIYERQQSISENPIFDRLNQWQSLVELSISMTHPTATNRVWTCGLTDGGLHNLFLGEDQMWAFDLGEPSLEPIPAFLTKFLMSFFHALGK